MPLHLHKLTCSFTHSLHFMLYRVVVVVTVVALLYSFMLFLLLNYPDPNHCNLSCSSFDLNTQTHTHTHRRLDSRLHRCTQFKVRVPCKKVSFMCCIQSIIQTEWYLTPSLYLALSLSLSLAVYIVALF